MIKSVLGGQLRHLSGGLGYSLAGYLLAKDLGTGTMELLDMALASLLIFLAHLQSGLQKVKKVKEG